MSPTVVPIDQLNQRLDLRRSILSAPSGFAEEFGTGYTYLISQGYLLIPIEELELLSVRASLWGYYHRDPNALRDAVTRVWLLTGVTLRADAPDD